jgi:hypothetical protein
MRLQVAKRDLESALTAVGHAMAPSGTDISSHFVFRCTPDGAEVLAFVGRLFAQSPVTCVVSEDETVKSFTVEGSRLLQWVKAVRDAALELVFNSEDKVVTAVSPRGSMEFKSLDPADFPYWDAMWADVEPKGTCSADKLNDGLSYARQFCSDKETKKPQLCLIECRDGVLYATDEKAITLVSLEGLGDSSLRIHRNDAGAVLKFLSTCGTDPVALLEHDRSLLLKRSDGAVFGVNRFKAKYPDIVVDRETPAMVWWKIATAEILGGIPFLTSGIQKGDTRLYFSRPVADGPVKMGMKATTDAQMDIDLPVIESGSEDGAKLPTSGFVLDYTDVQKVLSQWDLDTVTFSIHMKGAMGYVRFREERTDVDYTTACAWLGK